MSQTRSGDIDDGKQTTQPANTTLIDYNTWRDTTDR